MDSKCKYWMLLLTLLCVISLGFSLFRVFPCEVGNETFLGIVLSAVGIIVILLWDIRYLVLLNLEVNFKSKKKKILSWLMIMQNFNK